jgi:hypothetical protein
LAEVSAQGNVVVTFAGADVVTHEAAGPRKCHGVMRASVPTTKTVSLSGQSSRRVLTLKAIL